MTELTLERCDAAAESSLCSSVQEFSPLTDPRWPRLLERHKEASVFHTHAWLAALQQSYGYEPVGYTTSDGQELENAIIFCRVKSWMTGRRLVSIPFADHCQPLGNSDDLRQILMHVHGIRLDTGQRYLELRPLSRVTAIDDVPSLQISQSFHMHRIDLRPALEVIYKGMHDSCVRRKIKRAQREELVYTAGRSKEMLETFYDLLLLTRRRHQLPPQPLWWFESLIRELGTMMTIHTVTKDQTPIASIVTLDYKDVVVYKYGCSDERFSALGGTPLLFWKIIQQAKEAGAHSLDLGRSDTDEPGLSTFKERLGGVASELCYLRDVPNPKTNNLFMSKVSSWSRKALARMPDPVLIGLGRMIYRHMG